MTALNISFADHNVTDWDGNPAVTRTYVASIDGKPTGMRVSCVTTADDTAMRAALRNLLTNKGFVWSEEI